MIYYKRKLMDKWPGFSEEKKTEASLWKEGVWFMKWDCNTITSFFWNRNIFGFLRVSDWKLTPLMKIIEC